MSQREICWVVTANFTADGGVAYLEPGGVWSRSVAAARVFATEEEAAPLVKKAAAEEQRLVSDPYAIDMGLVEGVPVPLTARERIRATGPTVRIRRPDSSASA